MPDPWYELVQPETPLTQGDIILSCPLIGWRDEPVVSPTVDSLRQKADGFKADVVVMTQACDLEHSKVNNVVLCPHLPMSEYKTLWEEAMRAGDQNPSNRAWKRHCDDIRDGYVWNLSLLNSTAIDDLKTEIRVVDFHDVYTVPRDFIESYLLELRTSRLRLLPPYREHLSQSFARFFMRVGLPVQVEGTW